MGLELDGVLFRNRAYFNEAVIQSPEHDHLMWKQDIEDAWVRKKCDLFPINLEFTADQYPHLHESVMSFSVPFLNLNARELLIELGARFGDEAAGLTTRLFKSVDFSHREQGYQYGRFSKVLKAPEWNKFTSKAAPSVDRFLQIFTFLSRIENSEFNPDIELNWEFVVRHMCEPPYSKRQVADEQGVGYKHSSCEEVVQEIRQMPVTSGTNTYTNVLNKFEQVALELSVYD